MKIQIVGSKTSSRTNEVEEVVKKLFPQAEVKVGTKQYLSDLHGAFLLEVSSVYDKSKSVMAKNILEVLDLGVSDKVLKSL